MATLPQTESISFGRDSFAKMHVRLCWRDKSVDKRILDVLPEARGLVPSNHEAARNNLELSFPLLATSGTRYSCTQTFTQEKHSYTSIFFKKKFKKML